MSSKFRTAALIVNFCFIVGLLLVIFLDNGKYPAACYFFLGLFLVLFLSQCFVWSIKPIQGGFILHRLLFQRFRFKYSDIKDIDVVYVAYRLSGSEKSDETLKLKTHRGVFRFRAGDYMIFTEVKAVLFGTLELMEEFLEKRAVAPRKSDPLWKLKDYLAYIILALLIVGFIAIMKSR